MFKTTYPQMVAKIDEMMNSDDKHEVAKYTPGGDRTLKVQFKYLEDRRPMEERLAILAKPFNGTVKEVSNPSKSSLRKMSQFWFTAISDVLSQKGVRSWPKDDRIVTGGLLSWDEPDFCICTSSAILISSILRNDERQGIHVAARMRIFGYEVNGQEVIDSFEKAVKWKKAEFALGYRVALETTDEKLRYYETIQERKIRLASEAEARKGKGGKGKGGGRGGGGEGKGKKW